MAEVGAGASVHSVAKKYGVGTATIRRWREDAGLTPPALQKPETDPQTQKDYAALVLRHLELGLAAAERILEQTQDKGWLGEQPAGELATLYGVIFDKQARILAAMPASADLGGEGPHEVGETPALEDTAGRADAEP